MSTRPAVTMQDLELEHAELLPSRETLCVGQPTRARRLRLHLHPVGYGNTAQSGLLNVSALNGSFDNILSLGSGNIL